MPGRVCALPVLETSGQHTLIRRDDWSYLCSIHEADSCCIIELLWTERIGNNSSMTERTSPLLLEHIKGKHRVTHSRGGNSGEGGNRLRGSRKTIDRSSDRDNPETVSLSLRHLFPPQSWVTVKNINIISCFGNLGPYFKIAIICVCPFLLPELGFLPGILSADSHRWNKTNRNTRSRTGSREPGE